MIFSKMCFLIHSEAFEDVMKSKVLKFEYLKNKKSFRSEINFLLFSKLLSLNRKNILDINFKGVED